MTPYSNLGRSSPAARSALAVENGVETRVEASAVLPAKKAAGNGASRPKSSLRFPAEDGGRSLAKMAEGDLDAALQLLADRAQYITGAGGAAIALRREGREDMICRASAGSNAPELGALLSAEFGLSGESVRTRMPLRCDDAERDPRVNREGCREMGISSVVVMPVVHDDRVLGVFELFSGKVNAFDDRDMAALKRLSGMVETAVRLAYSAESPADAAVQKQGARKPPQPAQDIEPVSQVQVVAAVEAIAAALPVIAPAPERVKAATPKKPLFWSAALIPSTEKDHAAEVDRSHVPAVLRNLRKCQACGFPVSEGRHLCVECEEKKWRGKLRTPIPAPVEPPRSAPAAATKAAEVAPSRVLAHPETVVTSSLASEVAAPTLILSAGLPPSESWVASHKFVLAVFVVVAAAVAAIVFLH